jgi:hypothetical protein
VAAVLPVNKVVAFGALWYGIAPITPPLMLVALLARPVKLAVIVPALKLPLPSRATIADAVLSAVAVVAELLTLPAVAIVANLVSAIAADEFISALTISPSKIFALVTASAANLAVEMAKLEIMGADESSITYVEDRKGHDFRYAIDTKDFEMEFKNFKLTDFNENLKATVQSYL